MGRDTRELWSKRVERWKDSGLSAREFASEMGINAQTLSYWRWRLGKKTDRAPAKRKPATFIEVIAPPSDAEDLVETAAPGHQLDERPQPLEIVLRDELRIRVPVRFDVESLRRVVAALGAC